MMRSFWCCLVTIPPVQVLPAVVPVLAGVRTSPLGEGRIVSSGWASGLAIFNAALGTGGADRVGEDERNGPTRGGWVHNGWRPGRQNGKPE